MGADFTDLLTRSCSGDKRAADQLMPLVYDELREIAARHLRGCEGSCTLQPTAVVHEVYLRLAGKELAHVQGRTHFRAIAAVAMRHVLIDHARGRKRAKRGHGWQRLALDQAGDVAGRAEIDALDFSDALERLSEFDQRAARIVELRFLGGLSEPDIAGLLGVSERTVRNDWRMARVWLSRELGEHAGGGDT
jgi:RNA polymerase sigma-70 factor (ECF subfamily)